MEPNLNSPTPLLKVFKSEMFFVNQFEIIKTIFQELIYWRNGQYLEKYFTGELS